MTIIVIGWIICGIIHYGIAVAYFQRKYKLIAKNNAVSDRVIAAMQAIFGPIALIADLITGQYGEGWML